MPHPSLIPWSKQKLPFIHTLAEEEEAFTVQGRSLGLTEVLQEWHNARVWLAAQPQQPDTNPHLTKRSCVPCCWQELQFSSQSLHMPTGAVASRLNVIWLQLPWQQEEVKMCRCTKESPEHLFKARPCCPQMATGFASELQHHGTVAGPNRHRSPQPHHPLLCFCTQLNNNNKTRTCFG